MVSISKEDGVDFKVSVTTYPEIEIGEYKGLKAEKLAVKVTPEEVEAEINSMAERNARMVCGARFAGDVPGKDYQKGTKC